MEALIPPGMSADLFLAAMLVGIAAGFVKGAVGFAMPTILISGLGSILPAEIALAALILPTVATNAVQALRGGVRAAARTAWSLRVYIGVVLVVMLFAAQLVPVLPGSTVFLALGIPVTLFAAIQLTGWQPVMHGGRRWAYDVGIGAMAGVSGGISGIWGPPTVTYLLAVNTPKDQQLRAQGVIYGLGSVMLVAAHLKSGILSAQSAPFSALLIVPALIGMYAGVQVSDRLDQQRFRSLTQVVLVLAGLNLVRRGIWG